MLKSDWLEGAWSDMINRFILVSWKAQKKVFRTKEFMLVPL